MKKIIVFISFLVSVHGPVIGQNEEESFTPGGKPLALLFPNFHTHFSEGNARPAFDIKRAYLGYEYHFSPNWYSRVILDVGDPRSGRHQFSAFLKNAYMEYSKDGFSAFFGMIATTQFKVSENIWGYRYIEESFQDLYSFNSSADLGVNIEYKFSDMLNADFSVINGEGYRQMQSDDILRTGAGITFKPVSSITARIFADYMGKDVKQQSLATFLAWTGETFIAGAEYNYQRNVDMVEGNHMFGPSLFATYLPSKSIKVFGRYDRLNSSTPSGEDLPWQIEDDGQLVIAGIEYSPVKGVKLAPNFRLWNPEENMSPNIYSLFLNVELKF
jgi:hypothetical protein